MDWSRVPQGRLRGVGPYMTPGFAADIGMVIRFTDYGRIEATWDLDIGKQWILESETVWVARSKGSESWWRGRNSNATLNEYGDAEREDAWAAIMELEAEEAE